MRLVILITKQERLRFGSVSLIKILFRYLSFRLGEANKSINKLWSESLNLPGSLPGGPRRVWIASALNPMKILSVTHHSCTWQLWVKFSCSAYSDPYGQSSSVEPDFLHVPQLWMLMQRNWWAALGSLHASQ